MFYHFEKLSLLAINRDFRNELSFSIEQQSFSWKTLFIGRKHGSLNKCRSILLYLIHIEYEDNNFFLQAYMCIIIW